MREGRGVVRKDIKNVSKSAVKARTLGTVGGRSLKKRLSGQARVRPILVEVVSKTAPQTAVFCHHFHRYLDLGCNFYQQ